MEKNNLKLYETTLSQDVVLLQTKFTLFKRIINITMSATSDEPLDLDLMTEALNKTVERNDCARLRFVKKKGKVMQYILPKFKFESVERKEFSTEEEQNEFITNQTHHAIKYKKGEVIKPFFVKTFDGKDMVLLKVCHLNFDLYGLNVFFKDLFDVYFALKNQTELPKCPASFEDVIIKDLKQKNDKEYFEKNRKFFKEYLGQKEQPYYAGLNGKNGKFDKQMEKKKNRCMKMFFVKCDTKGFMHDIPKQTTEEIVAYCKENRISLANYLFFAFNVVQAKMNGKYDLLPLELCNCRGTMQEKLSAGTKVQSLACYTSIYPEKEYEQNLKEFCENQTMLYRHIGFSDTEFQMLLHKLYKSSMIRTYYSLTFSFLPMMIPDGVSFQIYSNEKCVLPAYVAVVFDVQKETMSIVYDCQTQLMGGEDVKRFHENLVETLQTALKNPNIKIQDIEINEGEKNVQD